MAETLTLPKGFVLDSDDDQQTNLPSGFVIDTPDDQQQSNLPSGFVLDTPERPSFDSKPLEAITSTDGQPRDFEPVTPDRQLGEPVSDELMELARQHPEKFFRPGEEPEADPQGFVKTLESKLDPLEATKQIPILGGVFGALESAGTVVAAKRLQKGEYPAKSAVGKPVFAGKGPVGVSRENDEAIIADAIKRASKKFTVGGRIAQGITALPVWMLEFAATGGLAKIGDKAARKVGERWIGQYAKTKAGKAALATAGITAGAIVRSTTGLLPRVVEKAANRQELVEIGLKGKEGWATSLTKAWGDTVIESASEQTGEFITAGLGKLAKKLPFGKVILRKLQSAWTKKTGGTAAQFIEKSLTKAGYSNIIGEIGEERLGTLLREATGISDREGDFATRIWEGIKEDLTPENLLVEATVLAVPGATRVAAGLVSPEISTPAVGEEVVESADLIKEQEDGGQRDEERRQELRERPGQVEVEQRQRPAKAEKALETGEGVVLQEKRQPTGLAAKPKVTEAEGVGKPAPSVKAKPKPAKVTVTPKGKLRITAEAQQKARQEALKADPTAVVTAETPVIQKQVEAVIDTDFSERKPLDLTSARQADIAEDREALGMTAINSKSRRGWKKAQKIAKKQLIHRKADDIADEILAEPVDDMGDVRTAGLTIRMAELKKEHKLATRQLKAAKTDADIAFRSAERNRIFEKLDKLHRAVNLSGSQAGRTLAAQKLQINEDFELESTLLNAKSKKKAKLSQKEMFKFEKLTNSMDRLTEKIDTVFLKSREDNARKYLRRGRAATEFKKMSTEQKKTSITRLGTEINTLLKQGCGN